MDVGRWDYIDKKTRAAVHKVKPVLPVKTIKKKLLQCTVLSSVRVCTERFSHPAAYICISIYLESLTHPDS